MAKKFSGNQDITVTPKSKSTTWQYTGGTTPYEFTLNNEVPAYQGYNPEYRSFAVKSKNDLVVTTMFANTAGKVKKVTNTIKNYFKDPTADYKVYYSFYTDKPRMHTVRPNTDEGENGLFGTTDGALCYLASSSKKADLVTFSGTQKTEILDLKGNDKYKTAHTTNITDYFYELAGNDEYWADGAGTLNAYDWAGADTYRLSNGSKLTVHDYAGKDTYTVADEGASAFLTSTDYAGNDTYELGLGSDFWTKDFKGNDTYKVTNNKNNLEDIPRINDETGNDKYYLDYATVDIVDDGGKDRYEASYAKVLSISDYGKGNDTVIVENSNLNYDESYIANATGNETYNFTHVSFDWETHSESTLPAIHDESGKDKYNLFASSNLDIKDEKGNDTYKINDSMNIIITDEAGNDKYNLTENDDGIEIYDINIIDNGGKDTYTITGTEDDRAGYGIITDSGNSKDKYKFTYCCGGPSLLGNVIDDGGKDSYTIANSYDIAIADKGKEADKYTVTQSEGRLQDSGGNDTYNISESYLSIVDFNGNDTYKINKLIKSNDEYVWIGDIGGKDSLTLGLNKADLVFMTDYAYSDESESWITAYNSLIIYDKTNKGFVRIADFYDEDSEGTEYSGYGEGRIETIKAGKTTLKDIPDADYFNNVAQDVINYIYHQTDFSSVVDVLQKGDAYDINHIIGYFEGTLPT